MQPVELRGCGTRGFGTAVAAGNQSARRGLVVKDLIRRTDTAGLLGRPSTRTLAGSRKGMAVLFVVLFELAEVGEKLRLEVVETKVYEEGDEEECKVVRKCASRGGCREGGSRGRG